MTQSLSRKNPTWTEQEIAQMREMMGDYRWQEIADRLGRTISSVTNKAKSLNIKKRIVNSSSHSHDAVLKDLSDKIGLEQAAEKLDLPVERIQDARRRVEENVDIFEKEMTPDALRRFKAACHRQASLKGINHLAEDFASWALIKLLEGRKKNSSMHHMVLAYMRSIVGAKDESYHELRTAEMYAKPIKEDPNPEVLGVIIAQPQAAPEANVRLFQVADMLNMSPVERIIFLLHWREDLPNRDIALFLNMSEIQVQRVLMLLHDLLKNNAGAKAVLSD